MAVAHDSRELSIVHEGDYPLADQHATATGRLLVRPIATSADVKANFVEFQNLKMSLLDPKTDIQVYRDREGKEVKRIKKSGCKKIATAFGLDVKALKREIINLPDGGVAVEYTVTAIAPNGRSAEGIGMCDTTEPLYANRKNHKLHDVYATAFTRASNRAVLDLVGGGEVSAEEISSDDGPNLPGRRPMPKAWLDKLTGLAKEMPDGLEALAQYVFEEIGAQYLSQEEIVRIADKLQKRKANLGKLDASSTAQAPASPEPSKAPVASAQPAKAAPAANVDPAAQERMHRASWIETATGLGTVSPAGKFVGVSGEQFEKAAAIISGGRDLVVITEAMGIEKFSTEAKRRFNGQLKNQDQIFSAALHILAEWCENHPSETIFPDTEIEIVPEPEQEEIDPIDMPF